MERLLADCETPFTNFRVEDCEGLPRAVFDLLPSEQSSLLSHFLYPDKDFIGALYLDVLKVSNKEAASMSYEDDFCRATFTIRRLVIESKGAVELAGARVRVNLPLGDVKLLLLKWKFECMRWEAVR